MARGAGLHGLLVLRVGRLEQSGRNLKLEISEVELQRAGR
jgi:hypothetical protein